MKTNCVRIKLDDGEKAMFQEVADKCCRGNISDMIRRSVRGGHAQGKISSTYLKNLIRDAVIEANEEQDKGML